MALRKNSGIGSSYGRNSIEKWGNIEVGEVGSNTNKSQTNENSWESIKNIIYITFTIIRRLANKMLSIAFNYPLLSIILWIRFWLKFYQNLKQLIRKIHDFVHNIEVLVEVLV